MLLSRRVISVIGLIILYSFSANCLADAEEEYARSVTARLEPIGHVRLKGEASPASTDKKPSDAVKVAKRTPKDIYQQHCSVCHSSGLAGAPKTADAAAWKPRMAKGMKTMLKRAIAGFNAMPAKGTCMQCSDADLEGAIKYMLPKG